VSVRGGCVIWFIVQIVSVRGGCVILFIVQIVCLCEVVVWFHLLYKLCVCEVVVWFRLLYKLCVCARWLCDFVYCTNCVCVCEVVVWFRLLYKLCVCVRWLCDFVYFTYFYCGSTSSFIFIISSLRSNYKGTVNISHNYREVVRYGVVDLSIFVNCVSFQYIHWNVNWFIYLALNLNAPLCHHHLVQFLITQYFGFPQIFSTQ